MDDSGFTALNFWFRISSAIAHLIKALADRDVPCPYREWHISHRSLLQDRTPYGRGLPPSEIVHPIKTLADRAEPCPYREWLAFHESLLQDRTPYGRGLPPSENAHLIKALADRECMNYAGKTSSRASFAKRSLWVLPCRCLPHVLFAEIAPLMTD